MKKQKVKIEKNVPIPDNAGRPSLYPWRTLKVGESFLVNQPKFMVGNANTRHAPKKFVTKKEGKGTRVWRIK